MAQYSPEGPAQQLNKSQSVLMASSILYFCNNSFDGCQLNHAHDRCAHCLAKIVHELIVDRDVQAAHVELRL